MGDGRMHIRRFLTAIFCGAIFASAISFEEPLDPAVAFQPTVSAGGGAVVVNYRIAEDYYLYRGRFQFSADGAILDDAAFPPGEAKEDDFFGKVEIYRDFVSIAVPAKMDGGTESFAFSAVSQGCAEKIGICYPPQKFTATLSYAALGNSPSNGGGGISIDEAARASQILAGGNLLLIVAAFFGFGLLLSFTPCVLPMMPIVAGIVAGQNANRGKAAGLAAVYSLGVAVVYTAAGIAAGFTGSLLAAALQTPVAQIISAAVFILLALWLFEIINIKTPAAFGDKFAKRGGIAGAFLMGGASAIAVSPCVAAPLAGALIYIGKTGDAILGGIALFAMAAGMSVLLIAAGAGIGFVPKAGAWSDSIRKLFGAAMLAMAIWVASPLLPTVAQMLLYGAILLGAGANLRDGGNAQFGKAIGIVLAAWGAILLIGAASGGRDILQPLSHFRASPSESVPLSFAQVKSPAEWERAFADARGRPVMLEFYADWCVSCEEMERFTFADSEVRSRLSAAALIRADVTDNDDSSRALLARFGLFGPPGIIFFDNSGREIQGRVIGYQSPEDFLASLSAAGI